MEDIKHDNSFILYSSAFIVSVKSWLLPGIRFLVKQVDELDTLWFAVGDLPVVISCASVALADAGIMMYDLVASVSVVWILYRYGSSSFYLHFQYVVCFIKYQSYCLNDFTSCGTFAHFLVLYLCSHAIAYIFWCLVLPREESSYWSSAGGGKLPRRKFNDSLYAFSLWSHSIDGYWGMVNPSF